MEFERYFLTNPNLVARVPIDPNTRIVAVAYPLGDNVYFLHRKPATEAQISQAELVLAEEEGSIHIRRQSNKPVFIWCQDNSGQIKASKIYSIPERLSKTEQTST